MSGYIFGMNNSRIIAYALVVINLIGMPTIGHCVFGQQSYTAKLKQNAIEISPADNLPFFLAIIEGIKRNKFWVDLNLFTPIENTIPSCLSNSPVGYYLGMYDLIVKDMATDYLSSNRISGNGKIDFRIELIPEKADIVKDTTQNAISVTHINIKVEIYSNMQIPPELQNLKKHLNEKVNHSPIFKPLKALIAGTIIAREFKQGLFANSHFIKSIRNSQYAGQPEIPIAYAISELYSEKYFNPKDSSITGGIAGLMPKKINTVYGTIAETKNKTDIPYISPKHIDYKCPVCGHKNAIYLMRIKPLAIDRKRYGYQENYSEDFPYELVPGMGYRVEKVFSIAQCTHCNHIFVTDPPSEEEDNSLIEAFLNNKDNPDFYEWLEQKKIKAKQQLSPLLKYLPKGGKIIDIGAGYGLHLSQLKGRYYVLGVEIQPIFAEFCNEKMDIPVLKGRLKDLNLPANSINAVTMFTVLEHVKDIHSLMAEINRILKNDGLLLISELPNLTSYIAAYQQESFHDFKEGHIHFFTEQSIRHFLRQYGFEIKEISSEINLQWLKVEVKNDRFSKEDIKYIEQEQRSLKEKLQGDLLTIVAKKAGPAKPELKISEPTWTNGLERDEITDYLYNHLPLEYQTYIESEMFRKYTSNLFEAVDKEVNKEEVISKSMLLWYFLNLSGTEFYKDNMSYITYHGFNLINAQYISQAHNSANAILSHIKHKSAGKGGISLP